MVFLVRFCEKGGEKACADSEVQGAGTGSFSRDENSQNTEIDHSDWLTTANSNTDVNRTARKTEQK